MDLSGRIRGVLALWLFIGLASLALAQGPSVIKEIQISGLQNINKSIIETTMRTKVGQPYAQAQLDDDKRAILDLGFFQAVDVRAREIDAQNWAVIVELVEYPKIKEVRIVGNTVISTAEILEALKTAPSVPIAPDNVFNLRSQKPAADAIVKLYTDKGYFAQVSEFGPLSESPETVSLTLLELTVNSVKVIGATRTKPSVLNKIVKTRAGDPFNANRWRKDNVALINTRWFDKVEPVAKETDDISKVDLVIDVTEARTGLFNIGAQLDPRSSFAGMIRFSDSNFRGTGQNYAIDFIQGTQGGGASIAFDYGNPFYDDRGTSINYSLYSRNVYRFTNTLGGESSFDNNRYFERHTGGSASMTRPLKEDTRFLSIGIRGEKIETTNVNDESSGFIRQDGEIASLSGAYIVNNRDLDIDPSRGDWFRFQLEPGWSRITAVSGDASDQSLLGSHAFFRTDLEYRKYWSPQPPREKLDDPRRVFAFRAHLGSVAGTVPFFEQFFVGGSNSVRGYQEDRFWGKNMATFSLEYRHPVQKSFNAIAFVDYGSAWGGYGTVNNFTQSNTPKFKLGYGVGFSFRTPLGPIRLDFGWNQEGGSRTHFMIGTSF